MGNKSPGIHFLNRGKVRDLYEVGGQLLLIATDRLSAFDVVLPTPIPDKGRVLTQLSLFWFQLLRDVIPNHVVTATDFPAPLAPFPRAARRPRHALPANESPADRMRRARIPVRLGLEGLSRHGKSLRDSPCRRAARIRTAAGSRFSRLRQKPRGPR
jgi:phosphoribosylaminoimidazole-succinocarboxamide synthase